VSRPPFARQCAAAMVILTTGTGTGKNIDEEDAAVQMTIPSNQSCPVFSVKLFANLDTSKVDLSYDRIYKRTLLPGTPPSLPPRLRVPRCFLHLAYIQTHCYPAHCPPTPEPWQTAGTRGPGHRDRKMCRRMPVPGTRVGRHDGLATTSLRRAAFVPGHIHSRQSHVH
jgi:hypothetical protein